MWLADKVRELEQRIEKLEQKVLSAELNKSADKAKDEVDEMVNHVCERLKRFAPKPHYTRGQQVIVFCAGDYVNWWKDAIYLEKLKEDVHLVFIQETSKLGQFPDRHIQPLSKPEKPAFTRGQDVEVQMVTGWTKGLMVYFDDVASIVYVDEKCCSLPFMNTDIRPITQTTEG